MIRVGTSGWSYPSGKGTWKGVFYPPGTRDELAYYAERFDTVEVNSTFYRVQSPQTALSWTRRTPADFLFSIKLFQKFTHPELYLKKTITLEDCMSKTSEVDELKTMILNGGGSLGNLPPPTNFRR